MALVAVLLAASPGAAQPAPSRHLQTSGTHFVRHNGQPFAWRGITAFRLLEMEAAGRSRDVDAYLRWAASRRLTVVRVLAMARHLFELPPEKGAAALDALLARAARHGLHVEVVALADTASYEMDMAGQVRRIGAICARHPNALLEIANEPYHATQRAEVHDAKYLERLRAEVPSVVPVALGAGDNPAVLTGGDYVTVHFPRSPARDGWGWVMALADAAGLLKAAGKPVIDDEPIGAGQRFEPGRRDADPEKFRAAALAGRLAGIGATFHYEGGLQARIPRGRELECLAAWQQAWTVIPGDTPVEPFEPGPSQPARSIHAEGGTAFAGMRGPAAWVLVTGTTRPARIEWGKGWSVVASRRWPHSRWYSARRRLAVGGDEGLSDPVRHLPPANAQAASHGPRRP